MRKMKIENWIVKSPDFDDEGKQKADANGKPLFKDVKESLLDALTMLVNNKKPEDIPRGLDNFRLMHGITKAFDKARKGGVLELEDTTYVFLKNTIEKDILSTWGSNPDFYNAVEEFMELKSEG